MSLRTLLLVCVALLSLASLSVARDVCEVPPALRVSLVRQTAGLDGRGLSARDLALQNAFAQALATALLQTNGASPLNGFPSTRQYRDNRFNLRSSTSVSPPSFESFKVAVADADFQGQTVTNSLPDMELAIDQVKTQLTNPSTTALPSDPYTSLRRVAILINDGQISGGTTVANSESQWNALACKVEEMQQEGIEVFWISSNRSAVVNSKPIPNLAGGMNSQLRLWGNGVSSKQTNYFQFDDFSDLMSPRILGAIAANLNSAPDRPVSPSCVVSGDAHVTTFDGLHFDYSNKGDYWLFRGLRSNDDNLDVQYRAAPCASGVCVQGAAISDNLHRVEVVIADRTNNPQNAYITVNGKPLPLADYNEPNGAFTIRVKAIGTSSFSVEVQFSAGHNLFVRRNLVRFTPGPQFFGRSTGMCGNWNGCPADDMLTSCRNVLPVDSTNPTLASQFGDSWTVLPGQSLFTSAPPQGVAAWEVSYSAVCPFNALALRQTAFYNRWPSLPLTLRNVQSNTALTTFGKSDASVANVALNNPGLLLTKPFNRPSVHTIPAQCAQLRGALLADCLTDVARGVSAPVVESSHELLFEACAEFCLTGRLFTNLVVPSDCYAAHLCSLDSKQADLHTTYSATALPEVTFGNPNTAETFFQPKLGLAGRYVLSVTKQDLCGQSVQYESIDIRCATPAPRVSLSFPGLTTASGTQPTSTDPLVSSSSIVSVVPDRRAGYPEVTVQANVFPQSSLFGHSWKIVEFPRISLARNVTAPPTITGASSNRARFTPDLPGAYVLEYAVWTGCSVVRSRALVHVACSLFPPTAQIQPDVLPATPGNNPSKTPVGQNNVAIHWKGITGSTPTGWPGHPGNSQALLAPFVDRWHPVELYSSSSFDLDTAKKNLQYKWALTARRTDSLGIQLLSTPVETVTTTGVANSAFHNPAAGTCAGGNVAGGSSQISFNSRARLAVSDAGSVKIETVYLYGIPVTPVRTESESTSPAMEPVPVGNPAVTNHALVFASTFGASAPYPEGSVSMPGAFRNGYIEQTVVVTETNSLRVQNTTTHLQQPLCRVTLTQTTLTDGSSKAVVKLEEVGDLPKPWAPNNYCKDAVYEVALTVRDECAEATDSISLQPTCDGFVHAITNNDQVLYWDRANNRFPPATIDAAQSFEQQAPTSPQQDRALQFEWTPVGAALASVGATGTGVASAQPEPRFREGEGFTAAGLSAKTQSITAEWPGTYTVGVRVSNKCVVSPKANSNVIFSCHGAYPCDATYSEALNTAVGGNAPAAWTAASTPITLTHAGSPSATAYAQLNLIPSVTAASSPSHSPIVPRYRMTVTSSPAASAYQSGKFGLYERATAWSTSSALSFRPDVAGDYKIAVEYTEGCGCVVKKIEVSVKAECRALALSNESLQVQMAYPDTTPTFFHSAAFPTLFVGQKMHIKTPWAHSRRWVVTGPAGESSTHEQEFLYTFSQPGAYQFQIGSHDGCQATTNSTTIFVQPSIGVTCTGAPVANARVVQGASLVAGSANVAFQHFNLPRVMLAAEGGFASAIIAPWHTNIEWTVTAAPEGSAYRAGVATSAPATMSTTSNDVVYADGFSWLSADNKLVTVRRTHSNTKVTTTTRVVRLPLDSSAALPADVTAADVWGTGLDYKRGQWGPTNSSIVADYNGAHSQVGVVLDKPGQYKFKLRYTNGTSHCPSESEVVVNAVCSASAPTAAITHTPASPVLDPYRPLRVALNAAGSDADAADANLLSYAWSFVSAPAQISQFSSNPSGRPLTEQADPHINHANGNFPPLFNPHTRDVSFLAMAPGNYTLQLQITDGCNVATIAHTVLVGCGGKNNYGSVESPLQLPAATVNPVSSGPANTLSYTITDALNGAVPVGGASADKSDVTRPLHTRWNLVSFTPQA